MLGYIGGVSFYNIKEAYLITFLVGSYRFVKRELFGTFTFLAEHHKKLVFDTSGGIGYKPVALFDIIGVDGLDKTYGTDRYKVIGVPFKVIIFFDDMRYESEVVFYEDVARIKIAFAA